MDHDRIVRQHLVHLLTRPQAHITFDSAIKQFPRDKMGCRIENLEHTAWMLLFHLRIVQWDILEFCRNPDHESPEYPSGYWPASDAPESVREWNETEKQFRADLKAMVALVQDSANDLYQPFEHGDGQTLLREAMLVADHNSYHIGQLVDIRMLCQCKVRDW